MTELIKTDWLRMREALYLLGEREGIQVALDILADDLAELRRNMRVSGASQYVTTFGSDASCFDDEDMFIEGGAYRIVWGRADLPQSLRSHVEACTRQALEQAGFAVQLGENAVMFIVATAAAAQQAARERDQDAMHQIMAEANRRGVSPASMLLERTRLQMST